ncbi:MAG TPA: hypothetical protein GX401_10065 [Clostridiales bacterium]|nr:hypothetical protein [Clostridiales bacterium]
MIAEIVGRINSGGYDNPKVEELLTGLADKLSRTSGKKQYGYLKVDVKNMVNSIVEEMAKDERISSRYDLWYEQKFETFPTYTDTMPDKLPLSQNPDFKTIRNAVITEATNIVLDRQTFEDEDISDEHTPEPDYTETESAEPSPPPSKKINGRNMLWENCTSTAEMWSVIRKKHSPCSQHQRNKAMFMR